MKHIRKFVSYSQKRKLDTIIKESVMIVDDIYRVNITVDVTQSLLNAYVKKVKDTLDKNARQFYSDVQLAEEITKYVVLQGEIIGEGIQGNKYKIRGYDFYAFNLKYPDHQVDNSNAKKILEEHNALFFKSENDVEYEKKLTYEFKLHKEFVMLIGYSNNIFYSPSINLPKYQTFNTSIILYYNFN